MSIKRWRINAIANTVAGGMNSIFGMLISGYVVHYFGKYDSWLWFAIWQIFSTCQTFSASMSSPLIKYFSSINKFIDKNIYFDKTSISKLILMSWSLMAVVTLFMTFIYKTSYAVENDGPDVVYVIISALVSSFIMSSIQVPQAIYSAKHMNTHGAVNVILLRGITFGLIFISIVATDNVSFSIIISPMFSVFGLVFMVMYNKFFIVLSPESGIEINKIASVSLLNNYLSSVLMSLSIILFTAGLFQYLSYIKSPIAASFGFANVYGVAFLALAQALIQPMLALVLDFAKEGKSKDALNMANKSRKVLSYFSACIISLLIVVYFIMNALGQFDTYIKFDLLTVIIVISTHLVRLTSLPDSIVQIAFCKPLTQISSAAVESGMVVAGTLIFGRINDGMGVCYVALVSSIFGLIVHLIIRKRISYEM